MKPASRCVVAGGGVRRAAAWLLGTAGLLVACAFGPSQDAPADRPTTRPQSPAHGGQPTSQSAVVAEIGVSPVDPPATSASQQRNERAAARTADTQAPPPAKPAPPGTGERQELIGAARLSAVDELRQAIGSEQIREDLTVSEFLAQLGPSARREFRSLLGTSPQIGGARFPTPGTAEVQLQAEGTAVLEKLIELAAKAESSPVSPQELAQRLAGWRGRAFIATGGSASATVGAELRPRPDSLPPAWKNVTEEARRSAFMQARDQAVDQFIEAARFIEILGDVPEPVTPSTDDDDNAAAGTRPAQPPKRHPLTIGKALEKGDLEEQTRNWLQRRPVTRMQYTEDRQIEVKLAVESGQWVEQLRKECSNANLGLPEVPDDDWNRVADELDEKLTTTEIAGRAVAAETQRPDSTLVLPSRPPEWTRQALTARATAPPADASPNRRRLATRQAAHRAAVTQLRSELERLPVSDEQTLGDLARLSPAVRELLEGELPVRDGKAEYHADGSVTVEVVLSTRAFWLALEHRLTPGTSVEVPSP